MAMACIQQRNSGITSHRGDTRDMRLEPEEYIVEGVLRLLEEAQESAVEGN